MCLSIRLILPVHAKQWRCQRCGWRGIYLILEGKWGTATFPACLGILQRKVFVFFFIPGIWECTSGCLRAAGRTQLCLQCWTSRGFEIKNCNSWEEITLQLEGGAAHTIAVTEGGDFWRRERWVFHFQQCCNSLALQSLWVPLWSHWIFLLWQ